MPKEKPDIEVINPRYAGATPAMVALALLKHKPKGGDGKAKPSRIIADHPVRSSILSPYLRPEHCVSWPWHSHTNSPSIDYQQSMGKR